MVLEPYGRRFGGASLAHRAFNMSTNDSCIASADMNENKFQKTDHLPNLL